MLRKATLADSPYTVNVGGSSPSSPTFSFLGRFLIARAIGGANAGFLARFLRLVIGRVVAVRSPFEWTEPWARGRERLLRNLYGEPQSPAANAADWQSRESDKHVRSFTLAGA